MKLRYLSLLALIALPLSGCITINVPTPPVSESPTPSDTPVASPGPTGPPVLTLPASCTDLVPLSLVREQFWPSFEYIPVEPGWGGPEVAEYQERGGLVCLWGIPQSDAGSVWVFVAPLYDPMSSKLAEWQAAGLSECPPFLDGCYWEQVDYEEYGVFSEVHAVVSGFELRVQGMSESIDPLMVVARAAATSMGYV